jgi:peptide/nickel transport system ATP-binding protein
MAEALQRHKAKAAAAGHTLVEVNGLAKTFDVSPSWLARRLHRQGRVVLTAVDGVSFAIPQGQTFSLVGESGCGKSTVARLLVGLYQPTAGEVRFDGAPVSGRANRGRLQAVRNRLQMIFQDPYASLNPRMRVNDIVAEPIRAHRLVEGEAAIRRRVAELLNQVRLSPGDGVKFPHEFSGGQRQRISIARALASEPDFIVCDEPTSALDVSVQAQVLNLLKELQRSYGLTYLFISHDLAVVFHVSDLLGVMYLGRLVEWGPAPAIFAAPRHPYTRMLLDAIPDLEMSGRPRAPVAGEVPSPIDPPSGCHFHPRCPYAFDRCRTEVPAPTPGPGGVQVRCHAFAEGKLS